MIIIFRRICFLETVAGVPGMVAAMTRHLHSLRRLKRDFGWIHTLLGNDTFHYRIQFILNCYIINRHILHKQSIFVLIKRMLLKYQKKQSNYLKCLIVITSMTTNFDLSIYIQRQNGECRSASSVEVTRIIQSCRQRAQYYSCYVEELNNI